MFRRPCIRIHQAPIKLLTTSSSLFMNSIRYCSSTQQPPASPTIPEPTTMVALQDVEAVLQKVLKKIYIPQLVQAPKIMSVTQEKKLFMERASEILNEPWKDLHGECEPNPLRLYHNEQNTLVKLGKRAKPSNPIVTYAHEYKTLPAEAKAIIDKQAENHKKIRREYMERIRDHRLTARTLFTKEQCKGGVKDFGTALKEYDALPEADKEVLKKRAAEMQKPALRYVREAVYQSLGRKVATPKRYDV